MKYLLLIVFVLLSKASMGQQTHKDSILEFQDHLNTEYLNSDTSPLSQSDLKAFKGHDFFPIDEGFRVRAKFERMTNALPFLMKTTSDRQPTYEIYGVATFELDNQKFELNIYQSHELRETEEYRNYLFLPFTDKTNGEQTYSGGRFIDLEIPGGDHIIIDFNKAYNPYCAYSPFFSCPIPPKENDLSIAVTAGIKLSPKHK